METRIKKENISKNILQLCLVSLNGDIFNMNRTVFAKDISDDGKIRMTGLTESVAVIAIDKHGNESKAFMLGR